MQGVADGGKGTYPEGVFECGGGGVTPLLHANMSHENAKKWCTSPIKTVSDDSE